MNKIKLNDSLYSKLNSPKGDLKKKNVLLNTKKPARAQAYWFMDDRAKPA